ncbi:pentatricopeptide repeat-containing protein [Cucumis melo var. makuwa]|uniref:Pentatricopeptide repeat-containing protein n=1 Tax=Cucumis melo var. makuwa TaxID=1194695 RepID=A0A5A7VFY8_CUCMM|nr:pentatricopeptide repeat-containing protein [Cucumis melo var. makuwa]TYJ99827.1 pentatricopeptide repeat-containing protein [Cucumis melo var. makuwa]
MSTVMTTVTNEWAMLANLVSSDVEKSTLLKIAKTLLQQTKILVEGLDQNGFIVTKLIGKYVEHGEVNWAPTNHYTFPFVLKACGAMKNNDKGEIVRGHVLKCGLDLDLFVDNALIEFYSKYQDVETACKVFDDMPLRDIVSWNSMIVGYTLNGKEDNAIMFFHAMLHNQVDCSPDYATLVSILPTYVTKFAS